MVKKVLTILLVVLLTGWGGYATYLLFDLNNQLEAQNQTITKLKNDTSNTVDELNSNIEKLEKEKTELEGTVETQKKLLESRENFLAVLPPAKEALDRTENKIDPAPFKQKILEAQDIVAAEKVDPENINVQTQNVKNVVAEINNAIQAYDAEQERKRQEQQTNNSNTNTNSGSRNTNNGSSNSGGKTNTNTNNNGGGGGSSNSGGGSSGGGREHTQNIPGLDIVRQALDAVGGSWVRLGAADQVCSVDWAAACAHYDAYIEVDTEYLGNSYDWWYPIMMHEYAHQVQFQHYDKMMNSSQFKALFGSDVEWLADCMSMARMSGYSSGYGYGCSGDQINYGANAWNGNF